MMESKNLSLRCKTKTGIVVLSDLTEASSIGDLKESVLKSTKISPNRLRIRRGYPPITVNLEDNSAKILDVLTSPKEIIIIEEISSDQSSTSSTIAPKTTTMSIQPSSSNISVQPAPYKSTTCTIKPKENTNQFQSVSPKGVLLRRVVPANNSCLFTSINFCLTNGRYDESSGTTLRKIIADTVACNPFFYNEAFLGKENPEYVSWILNENHWGGAIEISILSNHYSIEIVVVDTQNTRLNRFGEDRDYSNRILVIYDGIHYDPLMLEPADPEKPRVVTIFPIHDDVILAMALELAREAKASRQFTDVQNFTIKCLTCQIGLQGSTSARQHAKETGHINFGEI